MKKQIITIIIITMAFTVNAQLSEKDLLIEKEKWEKELVINGEVGNPCYENGDWEKWQEDNPGDYFGLQEVKVIKTDMNQDGIEDALFYFPAINCVGGSGFGSDYAMLVYSHENLYLTNKNLTKTIEAKLKSKLYSEEVYRVNLTYKSAGEKIFGEFQAWKEIDANCCPGITKMFLYNPFTQVLEILD